MKMRSRVTEFTERKLHNQAFVALNFEHLPYLANPQIFIEGTYGYCHELERLAASQRILGALQY